MARQLLTYNVRISENTVVSPRIPEEALEEALTLIRDVVADGNDDFERCLLENPYVKRSQDLFDVLLACRDETIDPIYAENRAALNIALQIARQDRLYENLLPEIENADYRLKFEVNR